jgi:hypothetical protein
MTDNKRRQNEDLDEMEFNYFHRWRVIWIDIRLESIRAVHSGIRTFEYRIGSNLLDPDGVSGEGRCVRWLAGADFWGR